MKRAVILAGIITILTAGSHGTDRYVSLSGTNDYTGGYTNWVGAATQIQWAVDAATNDDTVLVSDQPDQHNEQHHFEKLQPQLHKHCD